jgi:hypothetical protein
MASDSYYDELNDDDFLDLMDFPSNVPDVYEDQCDSGHVIMYSSIDRPVCQVCVSAWRAMYITNRDLTAGWKTAL